MGAFHLEVGERGLATFVFDSPGRKLNVFDREALAELEGWMAELGERDDVACLVLVSGKPGSFIAGADVELIAGVTDRTEAEAGVRTGQRIFAAWQALPFPTVAAIDGICLGGGTELALASTFRVVSDRAETRVGLPEVRLGIIPAWGGCTRLPRRIGVTSALDLVLTGRRVSGRTALKLGLADALLPVAGFLGRVRDFAAERAAAPERRRSRDGGGLDLKERLLAGNPLGRKLVFDRARRQTLEKTGGHYPAPLAALDVIRTGLEKGEAAGFEAEVEAASRLAVSPVAKSLIHLFQLTERAKKAGAGPDADEGEPRPVAAAAVVGAGTMGGGIAQLVAHQAGVPVRLKDVAEGPLAGGMAHAAGLFAELVSRRRLSEPEARRRMALIQPGLDYRGFARADLVIEAIVEKMAVKQKVFAELAGQVGTSAVLASNTSSLSIDEIAAETAHPERVVGMHFFNPVHKMPLVEVIAGAASSAAAVATVAAFARRLGKTPVRVENGPGFLVNRLLGFYSIEALHLLGEGYPVAAIDAAMTDWGMPVGPLELTDEVGIDVAFEVAHVLHQAFGDRLPLPPWFDRAAASGRKGRKNRQGFYRYQGDERKGPDPEVYADLGVAPRIEQPDRRYLAERMVLRMVDEAARCLVDEVVAGAGDLDLALVLGTGFPPFRGGLCRWADGEGLGTLLATLDRFAAAVGERYRPGDALRETAEAGGFYRRFPG